MLRSVQKHPEEISCCEIIAMSSRFVDADFWIGLNLSRYDSSTDNYVYSFVDGTTTSFLPWKENEPDNQDTEHCIRLTPILLKFRTTTCSKSYRFVCEGENYKTLF